MIYATLAVLSNKLETVKVAFVFAINLLSLNCFRPYRLSVRTPPSQGGKRGSIPRRVTTSLLKDKSFAVQAQVVKLANKILTL